MSERSLGSRDWIFLAVAGAVLFAAMLVFSQTYAWYGDEEFELLAGQLINAGRTPYRDFFHMHAPLYIYLNALWMRLAGEGWRAAHAFSAICSAGAAILLSSFWFDRMQERRWKVAAAVATAALFGLNFNVLLYGTIGQAYGICLLLSVAAFLLALRSVDRAGYAAAFATGLCAGGATASTLLAAPIGPILWIWMMTYNRTGSRLCKSLGFLSGAAIPFVPLALLAAKAPRQVWFSLIMFPLYHRGLSFRGEARWNFQVMTGWLGSPQGMLLALLVVVGLLFLFLRSDYDRRQRSPFYLCIWLAGGLAVYLAIPYPTFPQYFVLLLPYVSILATLGLYAVGTRISNSLAPWPVLVAVIAVFVAGLAKSAYSRPKEYRARWPRIEAVAHELNRVTPRGAAILADDGIYFAAHRIPLRGLENSYGRLMRVSPELAKTLNVEPRATVLEWVAAGRFATISSCWPYDRRDDPLALYRLYPNHRTVKGCDLFWK
jgi:hypothetical protein